MDPFIKEVRELEKQIADGSVGTLSKQQIMREKALSQLSWTQFFKYGIQLTMFNFFGIWLYASCMKFVAAFLPAWISGLILVITLPIAITIAASVNTQVMSSIKYLREKQISVAVCFLIMEFIGIMIFIPMVF